MIILRNEDLRFIEDWARSEEVVAKENLEHLRLLCKVLEECDNRLFTSDDADVTIQEIFRDAGLIERNNDNLQDVLSDNIYSRLQDVRDAMTA